MTATAITSSAPAPSAAYFASFLSINRGTGLTGLSFDVSLYHMTETYARFTAFYHYTGRGVPRRVWLDRTARVDHDYSMKKRSVQYVACILASLAVGVQAGITAEAQADSTMARLRKDMIESHLAPRGISNERVLGAFERVERHLFVDSAFRIHAYEDYPLPIGAGQTISQPYIVALMTQLVDPRPDDTVLEIGTGSGYQAAILGELAAHVYTIEIVDSLALVAASRLDSLGYDNITVRSGDGYAGWPDHAPFDVIVVTAAPAEIPQPLLDQLAEGGRLVIPVGEDWQELLLVTRVDGKLVTRKITDVLFVPMTGEAQKKTK